MRIKVADFGFATSKSTKNLQRFVGTQTYMAPEIIEMHSYDGFQTDIFSMAVILFMIVKGSYPF